MRLGSPRAGRAANGDDSGEQTAHPPDIAGRRYAPGPIDSMSRLRPRRPGTPPRIALQTPVLRPAQVTPTPHQPNGDRRCRRRSPPNRTAETRLRRGRTACRGRCCSCTGTGSRGADTARELLAVGFSAATGCPTTTPGTTRPYGRDDRSAVANATELQETLLAITPCHASKWSCHSIHPCDTFLARVRGVQTTGGYLDRTIGPISPVKWRAGSPRQPATVGPNMKSRLHRRRSRTPSTEQSA